MIGYTDGGRGLDIKVLWMKIEARSVR
jgi:hypothetical protein